jgi:glycosyltransferase involved in cell wall biosynthesis
MADMRATVHSAVRTNAPIQENRPEVSVVIVCYNQAAYLLDAVRSVAGQTWRGFEIVVVDDGSTDNTAEIAHGFPEAHYVHQSNRGLAAARNTGLRMSRGRYVVFLDADDLLLPDALEAGISCFREHPASGFVFGRFLKLHTDGSITAAASHVGNFSTDHYSYFLQRNVVEMHATVMYSREVLNSLGGFNEGLQACEDYDVYLRIARHWEVNQHAAFVAEYRQHATNMSWDNVFMLRSVLRVLRMERQCVRDPRGKAALRRGVAFWKRHYLDRETQNWGEKNARQRARALLVLIRHYPAGIPRYALKFVNNRMRAWASGRKIRMGSLRRLTPVSRQFGFDRGQPVDRYYIESFLRWFAIDIRGQVLEVGDDSYSRNFGGDRVTRQDVLHISEGHSGATIIGRLEDAPQIPSEQFDCVILTQTLHFIYDLRAALTTLYRILKPEGVLLVTLPGISQICHDRAYPEADSWRFTAYSAKRLFNECFPENEVHVQTYGNVLAATAFLYGLASRELKQNELDHVDSDYPVILGVRARKPRRPTSA